MIYRILGFFLLFSPAIAGDSYFTDLLDQVTKIEGNFEKTGRFRHGDKKVLLEVANLYEKETTSFLTSRIKDDVSDPCDIIMECVQEVKSLRTQTKVPTPAQFHNAFTSHPHFQKIFTSPIKVGSNKFCFSTRTYPSPDRPTPRRLKNMRRLIEGRSPICINLFDAKKVTTEDHHIAQKPTNEIIIQLNKSIHKKNHGTLHANLKKSEINRSKFKSEQAKARKCRGIRDAKKYLTSKDSKKKEVLPQ